MNSLFLKHLREFLPESAVLTSPEDCRAYGTDWTKTPGVAGAVVLPSSTLEVAKILKLCSEQSVPVIPSGGRTGLAGGVVATKGELALSLSRMNKIGEVDLLGRTVRVQAGAVTEAVHEYCEKFGLTWPIDLAAKGTSQIGGNLSTNAGGVRVIRYGMARKWVTALQAVTMNGDILELNEGLEKNNTGYDLLQLLVGSEGTLAVITEATLRLAVLPKNSLVFFFSLNTVNGLERLFEAARKGPFIITSFEFFSAECLEVVERKLGRKSRLQARSPFYALMEVEIENHTKAREGLDLWLEEWLAQSVATDGLIADSFESQKAVWGLREGITESLALSGMVRKYDVCVPVKRCAEFLIAARGLFDSMQLKMGIFFFGHFGDGSPHINFLKPAEVSESQFRQEVDQFENKLYSLLKSFHGSVSAEHGVGLLKKNWLEFIRSPTELSLYRSIKQAFDPKGLLNPGKILN